jgi:hypothetical protein
MCMIVCVYSAKEGAGSKGTTIGKYGRRDARKLVSGQ